HKHTPHPHRSSFPTRRSSDLLPPQKDKITPVPSDSSSYILLLRSDIPDEWSETIRYLRQVRQRFRQYEARFCPLRAVHASGPPAHTPGYCFCVRQNETASLPEF